MSTRDELANRVRDYFDDHADQERAEMLADALVAEGWRKMPDDETLWDLADDLLDGLNVEDLNPPSLTEYIADKIRARLMDGGQ